MFPFKAPPVGRIMARGNRIACMMSAVLLIPLMTSGCVSGFSGFLKGKHTSKTSVLRDKRMTEKQLDELSNAYADRFYTLMLTASERVMRDNPDLQQCRIMNGLRLLSVSSMYDIATSPDTVTQLVNQLVVVTLENHFWVDSGRAQLIWGDRAQYLVENLRKAREDIWAIAAKAFTDEQLSEIDLSISSWWLRGGGTEFASYVRFSDIAGNRGRALIEQVRGGAGLLAPLDRATEQIQSASQALERSFFWAKRLPLFANWQIEALWYDILVMPDSRQVLSNINTLSQAPALMSQRMNLVTDTVAQTREAANDLVDQIFRKALILIGALLAGAFVVARWGFSRRK
jgi:hypothetical protein